jgi:hypothetical protein
MQLGGNPITVLSPGGKGIYRLVANPTIAIFQSGPPDEVPSGKLDFKISKLL